MTVLQIIVIIFWSMLYLIWTIFCMRDLWRGEFIIKFYGPNISTAAWVAITVAVAVWGSIMVFS